MDDLHNNDKKKCPSCSEAIPSAAKVCPRCRQWLTVRSVRNPVTLFLILFGPSVLGLVLLVVFFTGQLQKIGGPPPYYSDFQGAIQILDSKMTWVESSDGPRLFLTGIVTNRSQVAWRHLEFECRFFNSKKEMVDAATGIGFLTILPDCDSAFRVSVKPFLSSNDYNSFKMSLSTAYNVRSLY